MQNNKIKFNNLTIEVKDVTPTDAKNILENHNKLNRNRNKSHVEALLKNMQNGTWRFNGDTIRFDKDGNLIDGQHRLAALAEYGKSLPMIIIKGFDNDTIKTIDQEIKPRNLNDLLRIDGVKEANNIGGIINRYYGMKYSFSFLSGRNKKSGSGAAAGNVNQKSTVDEKYNEYYAHPSFYDDLVPYARRCYRKMNFFSVSEIGAIYSFLYFDKHHSDDEIQGFLNRLFFNETDIHVIKLLYEVLVKDKMNNKDPMTSQHKSGLFTKAWNYYIKGKDVKVLSYNKNTEGIIEFI